jgi:hypothetical protein
MRLPLKDLKSLKELAKLIPPRRAGRPVHLATMHRWRTVGLRGHRLPCVRAGGIWCSTETALLEFFMIISDLEGRPEDGQSPDLADQSLAAQGW